MSALIYELHDEKCEACGAITENGWCPHCDPVSPFRDETALAELRMDADVEHLLAEEPTPEAVALSCVDWAFSRHALGPTPEPAGRVWGPRGVVGGQR